MGEWHKEYRRSTLQSTIQCKSIQIIHTQDNLLYSAELRERLFLLILVKVDTNLVKSNYKHCTVIVNTTLLEE